MNWCHVQDVVHLSPTGSCDKTPIRNIVMDGSKDRRMGGWIALDFVFKVLLWRNSGYEFCFRFMEMYKYKCSHLPEKFYHLWHCVTLLRSFAPHLSFQYGVPVPDVPLSFSCSVSFSCGNFLTKSQRFMLHSSWKAATLTLEVLIIVEKQTIIGWAPDQQLCKDVPNQYENIKLQQMTISSVVQFLSSQMKVFE